MKPRDYQKFNRQISHDIARILADHPDSFECKLFKPVYGVTEDVTTAADMADVVASVEDEERALEYPDEGTLAKAFIIPNEQFANIPGFWDGAGGTLENIWETKTLMVALSESVPNQTIVQWSEVGGSTGERLVTYYVQDQDVIGQGNEIFMRYYLIPFQHDGNL